MRRSIPRLAATLACAGISALKESLAQLRPRATARRLSRVERLIFKNLGENIAHQNHVIVHRNKGETATPAP